MADQTIDYAALAKQAGAVSSQPPPSGSVDYAALAKQAGAISSQPATPVSSDVGSFFRGLGQTLNPLPAAKAALTAMDTSNPAAAGQLADQAMAAQGEQFQKSGQAYEEGRYLPAAGHALAGAVPVLGPAAANVVEKLFTPGQRAEGAGNLAGMALPIAASAVAPKLAPALQESAEESYGRALYPTTQAAKAATQNKIAPGMAQRRMVALTRGGLERQAEEGEQQTLGQLIPDKAAAANIQVQLQPILDGIENAKQQFTVNGKVLNPAAVDALEEQKQILSQLGPQVSFESLDKARKILGEQVPGKNWFVPPDQAGKVTALKTAYGQLKDNLSQASPNVAAAKAEYSFWRAMNDVIDATSLRKVGQRGALGQMARNVGAAAGFMHGGPLGAAEGAAVFKGIQSLVNSTAWETISGATKAELASMLAKGDINAAAALVGGLVNTAANQPRRLQEPSIPMPAMAKGGVVANKSGSVEDVVRGSANVPLSKEGGQEASNLGQLFAKKGFGKLRTDRIVSGKLTRTQQTAQMIAQHAPSAKVMPPTAALDTWSTGFEGVPSEQADKMLEQYIRDPDSVPPKINKGIGTPPESFNTFKARYINGALQPGISDYLRHPSQRVIGVTHGRGVRLARAWVKAGAKPDLSIDTEEMLRDDDKPAEVYRLALGYKGKLQITPVDMGKPGDLKPGYYLVRHASTPWNHPDAAKALMGKSAGVKVDSSKAARMTPLPPSGSPRPLQILS